MVTLTRTSRFVLSEIKRRRREIMMKLRITYSTLHEETDILEEAIDP